MISQLRSIELNTQASQCAELIRELLQDELIDRCKGLTTEETRHLIERSRIVLFERLERETRDYRTAPLKTWAKPMTDEEAKKFGLSAIDFGKHTGRAIRDIATIDFPYLEWLADDKDELRQQIRRYLSWRDKQ